MREIDYVLESYRIAALIYVKYVMYNAAPRCPILQKLKTQFMDVTLEADDKLVDNENRLQHGSVIWILMMGGILYRDNYEKEYFAQAIARTIRGWWSLPGAKTWEVIEACLKKIAWVDRLRTSECTLLWSRLKHCLTRTPASSALHHIGTILISFHANELRMLVLVI